MGGFLGGGPNGWFGGINDEMNNATGANQDFGAMLPGVNPQIGDLAQRELESANEYGNNVGNYEGQQGALEQADTYNRINARTRAADINASAHGNLYSSNTQNQEGAGATSDLNHLSNERMKSNNRIQSQSNNMMQSAIRSKLGYNEAVNKRAEDKYNANMQGYGMRFNMGAGLLAGIGNIAGMVGSHGSKNPNSNSASKGNASDAGEESDAASYEDGSEGTAAESDYGDASMGGGDAAVFA